MSPRKPHTFDWAEPVRWGRPPSGQPYRATFQDEEWPPHLLRLTVEEEEPERGFVAYEVEESHDFGRTWAMLDASEDPGKQALVHDAIAALDRLRAQHDAVVADADPRFDWPGFVKGFTRARQSHAAARKAAKQSRLP